jgi:TonB family protein
MIAIVNYFAEANISLLILLLVYRFMLSGETNFRFMRFFLLGAILISLTLPLIHLQQSTGETIIPSIINILPSNWLPEIVFMAGGRPEIVEGNFLTLYNIGGSIYVLGLLVLVGLFSIEVVSVLKLMRSVTIQRHSHVFIAESESNIPTFSFFNFILIGDAANLSETERRSVIEHERVHADQLHSLDIILVSLVQIAFWFNPFIRLYKRYFVQLHEFEADARAVRNSDPNKYCSLLARVALKSADFSIANYFNNSLTVKRITMIKTIKKQISRWKLAGAMAAFPIAFFLLVFQDQVIAQEKKTVPVSSSNEVYSEVDELPSFKNGFEGLGQFISSNMKYPADSRKKGIEGTVFVEFIVEKDGKLNEIKTTKGLDPLCDAEALRVVKMMPAWIPGTLKGQVVRTKMVLPIKFKMG